MRTFVIVLAALAGLGLSAGTGVTVAEAQSMMAPATAPGGTEGRAGRRNVRRAIRRGEAFRVGRRGRIRAVRPMAR